MVLLKIVSAFLVFFPMQISAFMKNKYESPVYVKYVSEISADFIKEMKREHNLVCQGQGGGMSRDVDQITLMFTSYEKKTIGEAREFGIPIVENFLKKINNHEKIRSFLRKYPFDSNRVAVSISFYDQNTGCKAIDGVSMVIFSKGKIYYHLYNPSKHQYDELLVEPYEEARDLVLGKSG